MKELSIEEKAKRHDEAIEKAKTLYKNTNDMILKKWVEQVFPELKESEDERIRKEIIQFFKENDEEDFEEWVPKVEILTWLEKQVPACLSHDDEIMIRQLTEYFTTGKGLQNTNDTVVEWLADVKRKLEKQGEQKSIDNLTQQEAMDIAVAKCFEQGEQKLADNVEPKFKFGDIVRNKKSGLEQRLGGCIEDVYEGAFPFSIKYQDDWELVEQKPTNKVKPKFYEGDWVVWHGKCYKVNYNGCGYELVDQNALITSLEYGTVDENAHLWTIEDAKDGDVLCYKDEISLYKHDIKNCAKQETTFGGFVYHCCYDGKRFITDSLYSLTEQDKIDIHPATQEQRNILFQKMKEAGYEWDAEKKELKKIEQTIEIPFGAKDSELQEITYYIPKGFYAEIDDDKVVIKKGEKPTTWSEEDEMFVHGLIRGLAAKRDIHGHTTFSSDCIDITEAINWLKSIKKRCTWKPNDEQMNALDSTLQYSQVSHDSYEHLNSLYNDLKKLKD